jgi:hypothetical protein
MVMPDLEPFQAPDGTVISGRVAYNQYCKEKNVTNPADFKDQWEKQAKEREKIFTPGSGHDRERRRRQLAENYKEFKTYGEFQRSLEKLRRG